MWTDSSWAFPPAEWGSLSSRPTWTPSTGGTQVFRPERLVPGGRDEKTGAVEKCICQPAHTCLPHMLPGMPHGWMAEGGGGCVGLL